MFNELPHRVSFSSPHITRRAFCATSGCAAAWAGTTHAQHVAPSLADDVNTYLGFGEHRAGTPSEERTAGWIRERLIQLGYNTELQRFPIRTILQPGGRIVVGSVQTEVFPQWLPPSGALGRTIEAPLLAMEAEKSGSSIRVTTKSGPAAGDWGAAQDAVVNDAAAKGALAMVMTSLEPTGQLFANNQHHLSALPIPVALLASRDLPALAAALQGGGATARLTLDGALTDTQSINVVARKAGRGRMLVISTPLTGWFHCGAERGPGVALMLRMAAALAHSERPVLVLGTGSHEIAHLGMDYVLNHGAPTPREVAFWCHFGASLGATRLDSTYGVTSPQFSLGTTVSEAWVRPRFASVMASYANGNAKTPGEAGQVIGAGFQRFAGMIGRFPGFHTPADRGEAIDYTRLEQIAQASGALIREMADQAD